MWVGGGTMLIWRVSQQATHAYPSICHNIGIFEMCFHVDATSWVWFLFVREGNRSLKLKLSMLSILKLLGLGSIFRVFCLLFEVTLELGAWFNMPLRLCLWPFCSFCQNVWVHCSQPLAHQLTRARTGKPMEVVDSGIMRRVQGFFISMQSVYSTLWSVLPGMLRYSDAWPFITKSHDQTDRVLSSIFSPYVQFNFSTDAGRLINGKFIQFVLTLLIFSVKCQYQVPKGCSIFDKDMFSCWFFKHKAVAYVPLARCSTLEAALTAISIFIAFGRPKSPYESTKKYEYDSVWLIWWPRDACCYLCGHAAHPLWGWRTFAKAGLEE